MLTHTLNIVLHHIWHMGSWLTWIIKQLLLKDLLGGIFHSITQEDDPSRMGVSQFLELLFSDLVSTLSYSLGHY